MTRINLLPWREIRRRERDRKFLTGSVGAWVVSGLAVFYAQYYVAGMIDHQNARNSYLQSEIAKVEAKIKEIESIRRRREALIARMEVIQQLQRDRTQVVHVFDDLVRKLPKGVYFTGLTRKGKGLTLQGFAQSNARVSALMQNLDSSDWFNLPDLQIIQTKPSEAAEGTRVSGFTLRVTQAAKKKSAPKAPTAESQQPQEQPGQPGSTKQAKIGEKS